MRTRADVLVVGAGLAGLTAATDLTAAGLDVLVVEAADRVGGRIRSEEAGGQTLDTGGAYTGTRHTAVRALAATTGVPTLSTAAAGDSLFDLRGRPTRSAGAPPLSALALGDVQDRLEELAGKVCLDDPAVDGGAAVLDTTSVAAWCAAERLHPDAELMLTLVVREMLAVEPADVSLLHLLFYLRSGGGMHYLTAFADGAQESRFAGGAALITERMAARLCRPPELGRPVRRLTGGAHGVTAACDGLTVDARAALVTAPPATAHRLRIEDAARLVADPRPRTRSGTVKIHVLYPKPFWRHAGLSGWITGDAGPVCFVVDDSAGRGGTGVLTGFVTGDAARRYAARPPAQRRAQVIERLAGWLGPAARSPLAVVERDWRADPYAGGCYGGVPYLGGWTRAHHRSAGRPTPPWLFWAGSERTGEFYGHMEGAVRSGHAAAAQTAAFVTPARRRP